jgi:PIN domain nuclease of toxin-antitoxin system
VRLLLDTQLLIWSMARTRRLSARAASLIEDVGNEKLFSAASIWEVAIKSALRRPDFDIDPVVLTQAARLDFVELPVTSSAAARVAELPRHHRDPFDRLLIAQAAEEGAQLVTVDAALSAYSPHVLLV